MPGTESDKSCERNSANDSSPTSGVKYTKYNPGGRVGALLARRQAVTKLKTSPPLLAAQNGKRQMKVIGYKTNVKNCL